ncbi:MAG: GIY-YIG nuclease family protein [Candidatus Vogelbacteria bacterium]|nr:GIY-YIG nuclease family protein [Candidatus Vogelbacteria bacterium]
MFFYTYVLLSEKDGKMYAGWTIDLKHRLGQHNKGLVGATCDRRPFKLIYYEACGNREKEIVREKYLKSGYGRKYLKDRT